MDAGIWNEIGLEFVEINVERAIESKRGSDGRNNYDASDQYHDSCALFQTAHTLSNQAVEVNVVWPINP